MSIAHIIYLLALLFSCKCESGAQNERYLRDARHGDASHLDARQDQGHRSSNSLTSYETWVFSIIASCVVGLSGVVPLIFIPVETGLKLNHSKGGTRYLRLLLSFAVGSLLGDVFLHLLPEAWDHQKSNSSQGSARNLMVLGLSVLLGMFAFIVLEMIFSATQPDKKMDSALSEKIKKGKDSKSTARSEEYYDRITTLSSSSSSNGKLPSDVRTESNDNCYQRKSQQNGHHLNGSAPKLKKSNGISTAEAPPIHIAGYLNLMANCVDNFTHGLAVAASFLVSCKMGVLTTFAILIHEIPHEIGDFAILLKSGFHPWTAAKAQISTATIGVAGVIVALSAESIDRVGVCTSYILPFTAGGFLNIALVNVLPDLLDEKDPWESAKQFLCLCIGIGVMAFVNFLV